MHKIKSLRNLLFLPLAWLLLWAHATLYAHLPQSVGLLYFEALSDPNGVKLHWETGSEVDIAAFKMERKQSGEFVWLQYLGNQGFIGQQGSPATGYEYTVIDYQAVPGESYTYRLVEVSMALTEVPIATAVYGTAATPTSTSTPTAGSPTATETLTTTATSTPTPTPTTGGGIVLTQPALATSTVPANGATATNTATLTVTPSSPTNGTSTATPTATRSALVSPTATSTQGFVTPTATLRPTIAAPLPPTFSSNGVSITQPTAVNPGFFPTTQVVNAEPIAQVGTATLAAGYPGTTPIAVGTADNAFPNNNTLVTPANLDPSYPSDAGGYNGQTAVPVIGSQIGGVTVTPISPAETPTSTRALSSLYLWGGFLVALLVFGTAVVGTILIFTRSRRAS